MRHARVDRTLILPTNPGLLQSPFASSRFSTTYNLTFFLIAESEVHCDRRTFGGMAVDWILFNLEQDFEVTKVCGAQKITGK